VSEPLLRERVLVTGAFGNIGRNAVAALTAHGYRVRALRFERPDRAARRAVGPGVEVVSGDVRDRAAMDAAVRGCDVVVHLAYLIPPPALEKPDLAESINTGGTRTILDACRAAARPPRFLFASTLDVYGVTAHLAPPRRVGDPVSATDVYSGHKIEGERMVREGIHLLAGDGRAA
jgi:nucleoside-diphosphate-sugar epimerase